MKKPKIELEQELKSAQEHKQNVYNAQVEASKEGRETSKDFYYRLVLLSGGVISLSITFIGYLVSLEDYVILYPEVLLFGWLLLLVCIFASMYRNHVYNNFIHWQLGKAYSESGAVSEEMALEYLQGYPEQFINIQTKDELNDAVKAGTQRMNVYKGAVSKNEKKERKALKLWVFLQNVAHVSFVLGLTIIVVFAAFNVPHAKYISLPWKIF